MHGYQWAEVAPAAPALAELIPPLLILCGLIFALGCVTLIRGFVTGVFGIIEATIGHIPGVGGLVGSALTRAEQAISNALGSAITGIDARIASQFHNLANAVVSLWHHLETSAENVYDIAKLLAGAATFPDVRNVERDLRKLIKATEAEAARALRRVHGLETTVTQTIPRNLVKRLAHVEHAIAVTLPREIRTARDLAREAEDGVARLWDRVRALEAGAGAAAIAAAVAAVLAAIGLDWLSCKDGAKRVGRSGCGLWDDLGNLFGLLIDGLIFVDLCQVIPLVEGVLAEFEGPLVELISTAANAACAHPPGGWTELSAPPLNTPTAGEITATI